MGSFLVVLGVFLEKLLRKLLQFLFIAKFWGFYFFLLDFSNVYESDLTSSCLCSFCWGELVCNPRF